MTNGNSIHEEIKYRVEAGNSCYDSVQTLFSSRFLSKNLSIKIYKAIILPVALYSCEVWFLTLKEKCRLSSTIRNFIVCTVHLIYAVRVIKSRRLRCSGHLARMKEGRNAFKTLTGTPTKMRLLGRPRRR